MQKLLPYTTKSDERGVFLGITQDVWAEVNYVKTVVGQFEAITTTSTQKNYFSSFLEKCESLSKTWMAAKLLRSLATGEKY